MMKFDHKFYISIMKYYEKIGRVNKYKLEWRILVITVTVPLDTINGNKKKSKKTRSFNYIFFKFLKI